MFQIILKKQLLNGPLMWGVTELVLYFSTYLLSGFSEEPWHSDLNNKQTSDSFHVETLM